MSLERAVQAKVCDFLNSNLDFKSSVNIKESEINQKMIFINLDRWKA